MQAALRLSVTRVIEKHGFILGVNAEMQGVSALYLAVDALHALLKLQKSQKSDITHQHIHLGVVLAITFCIFYSFRYVTRR